MDMNEKMAAARAQLLQNLSTSVGEVEKTEFTVLVHADKQAGSIMDCIGVTPVTDGSTRSRQPTTT